MDQALIQHYFAAINPKSSVPVYRQLEECFEKMIDDLPNKRLLPVEREIASILNLSRGTVRKAMESFVAQGKLIRNRKGTFIHKPEKQESAPGEEPQLLNQLNPLVFGMDMLAHTGTKRTIRVQLYEDTPLHLKFWKEITEEFNRWHPKWNVVPVWQGNDNPGLKEYCGDLLRLEHDILQLPVSRGWEPGFAENFTETSPRMRNIFQNEEYQFATISSTFPELLNHSIPISAGFRWMSCNQTLLDSLNLPDRPDDLYPWIGALAKHLPDGISLIDRLFCLTLMIGFSMDKSETTERAYLHEVFHLLRQLPDERQDLFSLSSDPYLLECISMFQKEKIALLYFIPLIQKLAEPYSFPVVSRLIMPARGFFTPMNCNSFAINPHSRNKDGAEAFLIFLLSEKVQRRIASDFQMVPMLKAARPALAESLAIPEEELIPFIDSGREQPYFSRDRFELVLKLWEKMPEILAGHQSEENIIQIILEEERHQ